MKHCNDTKSCFLSPKLAKEFAAMKSIGFKKMRNALGKAMANKDVPAGTKEHAWFLKLLSKVEALLKDFKKEFQRHKTLENAYKTSKEKHAGDCA